MTMVSPIHLMLFASRKIELLPDGVVRVDNWINLQMDPRVAATVAAFRPVIENLVIRASSNPETITELNQQEDKAIQALRQICKMNAGRHGMEQVGMSGFQTRRPPRQHFEGGDGGGDRPGGGGGFGGNGEPPEKRGNFNRMFGGHGYGGGFSGRGGGGQF